MPQSIVDLAPALNLLKQQLADQWRELLQVKKPIAPKNAFAIQKLLQSGFLPNQGESLEKAIQLRLASRKLLAKASNAVTAPEPKNATELLELSHRSQIAIARLVTETSQQLEESSMPNSQLDRSAQSAEKLISIACNAVQRDAVSSSLADHATAMSIARIVASLSLDSDCSRVVKEWNSLQTKRRLVRSSYRAMEEAAQSGVQLHAEGTPNWRPDTEPTIGCGVKLGTGLAALPVGIASIQLHNKTIASEIGSRSSVTVGPNIQPQTVSLTPPKRTRDQTDRTTKLIASLRFRGHTFESVYEMASNLRNVSVSQIASPGLASIVIQDQRAKRRARTLVLDCSASMSEPQYVEGTAAASLPNAIETSKLAAARTAISDILNRWRGGSDLIGVSLFGHRVALGTSAQGTLFQNRYYANFPFPQTLRACEDVKLFCLLGDLPMWNSRQ